MPNRIVDGKTHAGQQFNPYKVRVYLGSAQNITSQGTPETVVNLVRDAPPSTLSFDASNNWSDTNHRFTAPIGGYYFVAGNVSYNPVGAMTWLVINAEIRVNGVDFAAANTVTGPVTAVLLGTSYNALAYDLMYLNSGDLVTLETTQQNSAGLAQGLNANSKSTYLSVHLIST